MKITFLNYSCVFILGIVVSGASSQLLADDFEFASDAWKLSRGGKIYDKWFAEMNSSTPKNTHPAYPSVGKKKGGTTWRCKECHGWDYNGRNGAYSKGSHFTGIKGVRGMVGKPLSTIKSVVRDSLHGYTKSMIPDNELNNLAYFISKGQVDMTKYIDFSNKKIRGSSKRGANFFQTLCAICHGADGKRINFHNNIKKPEYIGTVANKNPWEIFHKIRNGQPGAVMISLRALSIQDQLDIIAYLKLLPIK